MTGKLLHTIPLDEPVHGMAFSADGKFLATSKSKKVNIFDTRDWSVVKHFKTVFFNNFGDTQFAKNNRLILAGQKGITIWNSIDDNIFVLPMNATFPKIQISQDGSTLAIKEGNLLRVWDLEIRNELLRRHSGQSDRFTFSGKKEQLYVYDRKLGFIEIPWRTQDLIDEACRRLPPLDFDKSKNDPGIYSYTKSLCSS